MRRVLFLICLINVALARPSSPRGLADFLVDGGASTFDKEAMESIQGKEESLSDFLIDDEDFLNDDLIKEYDPKKEEPAKPKSEVQKPANMQASPRPPPPPPPQQQLVQIPLGFAPQIGLGGPPPFAGPWLGAPFGPPPPFGGSPFGSFGFGGFGGPGSFFGPPPPFGGPYGYGRPPFRPPPFRPPPFRPRPPPRSSQQASAPGQAVNAQKPQYVGTTWDSIWNKDQKIPGAPPGTKPNIQNINPHSTLQQILNRKPPKVKYVKDTSKPSTLYQIWNSQSYEPTKTHSEYYGTSSTLEKIFG